MSSYVLATGSDERYFPGLLVSLVSALHASEKLRTSEVDIYILDGGISEKAWKILNDRTVALNPRLKLIRRIVDDSHFEGAPRMHEQSLMPYARLWLPNIIKEAQVVYFDSDILIQRDIAELYDFPLQDDILVHACQDQIIRDLRNDCKWITDDITIPQDQMYFNSGVMKINLDAWRRFSITEKAIDIINETPENCIFWDQSILNFLIRNNWKLLDQSWNYIVHFFDYDYNDQCLLYTNLHFVYSRKPWIRYSREYEFSMWDAFVESTLPGLPYWARRNRIYRKSILVYWKNYYLETSVVVRGILIFIYRVFRMCSRSIRRKTEYSYNHWIRFDSKSCDKKKFDSKKARHIADNVKRKYVTVS